MPRKYDVAVNESGHIGVITCRRARRLLDTSARFWAGRYVEGPANEVWLSQNPRTILSGQNKGRRERLMQSRVWAMLAELITQRCNRPARRGIEVGVYEAETSCFLMERFPGMHLTLVDPYVVAQTRGMQVARFGRLTQDDLDGICAQAACNMTQFDGERYNWMIMDSQEAWIHMADRPMSDFIFLDHDHTYNIMRRDLPMYWRQLKPGGVYCGHDYGSRFDQQGVWGVTRAVDEFMLSLLRLQPGDGGIRYGVDTPSRVWWITKPPDWRDTPDVTEALNEAYISDMAATRMAA